MSDWQRPSDFEDYAEERAEQVAAGGVVTSVEEAFMTGALWAALVAEGRIAMEDETE